MRWLLVVLAWWCAVVASAGGPAARAVDEQALIEAGAESSVCTVRRLACFPAGTGVWMGSGSWAPIESVRAGDVVWTRDQGDPSGTLRPGLVARTFVREAGEIRRLAWARTGHGRGGGASGGEDASAAGGEEPPGILATAEHPFWVRGEGWVAAGSLAPGDEVRGASGWWRVVSATTEPWSGPVHNLEVVGGHTYFVGGPSGAVWVHNTCSPLLLMLPQMAFGAGPLGPCPATKEFIDGVADSLLKLNPALTRGAALTQAVAIAKYYQKALNGRRLVAGKPGVVNGTNTTGGRILGKRMDDVGRKKPGLFWWAHHLIPRDVAKAAEPLFKGFTHNGRAFPGIGLNLDDAWNGEWLPSKPWQRLVHIFKTRHGGSHPAYSKAMEEALDRVDGNIRIMLDRGDPIEAAMAYAEEAVARIKVTARIHLRGSNALPIHYKDGATDARWIAVFSQAVGTIP